LKKNNTPKGAVLAGRALLLLSLCRPNPTGDMPILRIYPICVSTFHTAATEIIS
jgi:hypothetical protein